MALPQPVALAPLETLNPKSVTARADIRPPSVESFNYTGGKVSRKRLTYTDASDFAWWRTSS